MSDGNTPLPRSLINTDGEPFGDELQSVQDALEALENAERKTYRNTNATEISVHASRRLLIVAGPGSGKSFLFLSRIQFWLPLDGESLVYVSSFVRKLVKDLQADVEQKLAEDDRGRVTVTTLHGLSRSLLERNRGTFAQSLKPHINVAAGVWQPMVWSDVREFHEELTGSHSLRALEKQFHTEEYLEDAMWSALRATYFTLCRFYNAVGFADMIVLAREAVDENPDLNQHVYWIIDEYQDFNASEDHLIRSVTDSAKGVLLAGDDEQALYQQLKSSLPEIIISYYDSPEFTNAMLPYCSRCSYFVCLAASAFISHGRIEGSIKKIYLPLVVNEQATKVQVVATSAPVSAVSYIQTFIADHQAELDEHTAKMEAGEETDPFLLILTPQRHARFYNTNDADKALKEWLGQWQAIDTGHSDDYKRVATYLAADRDPLDNFALRKILHYEGASSAEVHPLLVSALDGDQPLSSIDSPLILSAVGKCTTVNQIVGDTALSPQEVVSRLCEILPITNQDRLCAELEADPLSAGIFGPDEDADEAIETAGASAAVEMLTMVGSKGLSAKHVIIIGCDDVNLANTSRLTFFVALTRARESLHLITSAKAGGGSVAHSFVKELPEGCCEYVVYKKTGAVTESLSGSAAWNARLEQWVTIARRRR
jgi:hypothetical protein